MNKKAIRITLSILLILAFVVSVAAGCSSKPAPAPAPVKEKTMFEKIKEAGVITVGNSPDYPPFETVDDKGNVIGFDIDLMNAIAAELGVKADFKRLGFDTIITAVQNGQVNIGMSGFSITDERKQQIDFSSPYFIGGQAVVTSANSGIKTLEDLNGKVVAVGMGTTGEEAAKENIKGAKVKALDDYSTAFMMLKNGSAKAVVADLAVANEYISKDGFVAVGDPISYEENAIIVKKDNADLVAALNSAIKKLKDSGKIAEFAKKWEM
jgi:polar amino acid transport system substrate-binding protein